VGPAGRLDATHHAKADMKLGCKAACNAQHATRGMQRATRGMQPLAHPAAAAPLARTRASTGAHARTRTPVRTASHAWARACADAHTHGEVVSVSEGSGAPVRACVLEPRTKSSRCHVSVRHLSSSATWHASGGASRPSGPRMHVRPLAG
jgi:hypothetical protein